jgi:glycerol-3-phosphate dehydrogenase (NAD(P)+)
VTKVAFIGAGSWGTTAASLVATKAEDEVVLWARRPEQAETMNLYHENPQYLPDVQLPENLVATNDLEAALAGAEVVVMAVPSHGFRDVLKLVRKHADTDALYVSLTKGIEVETHKRMSQVLAEEIDDMNGSRIAVLSGPNLAKEIVQGWPAAAAIASSDDGVAQSLQKIFHTEAFRCYRNNDVVGTELGGAFKNVVAIASGIADGLGFGDNTKATLVTRGLAEMARFSIGYGGQPITFLGLAGVGDMMATCASPKSRNHSVGIELGRRRKIDEVLAEMDEVAEGVQSCRPILEMGRDKDVWMPITEAVVKVCHEDMPVEGVLTELLGSEMMHEFDGVEEYLRYNHAQA